MDQLAQKCFESEAAFSEGMLLLHDYIASQAQAKTFEAVQALFLDGLDERETKLLDAAVRYVKTKELGAEKPVSASISIDDLKAFLAPTN